MQDWVFRLGFRRRVVMAIRVVVLSTICTFAYKADFLPSLKALLYHAVSVGE